MKSRVTVDVGVQSFERFGKTLNLSMLECFFSNRYAGRADLFEDFSIWSDEHYRQLQGVYPVISGFSEAFLMPHLRPTRICRGD